MTRGPRHLFIPGPTNVPEPVRQAMNIPQEDMRAPDFAALTLPLFAGLKQVMNCPGEVMLFPGSGTSAWEAAITNTLNPGDKVLMARYGQFSTLWVKMAQMLGLDPIVVDVPWGAGVPWKEFGRILGRDKDDEIKAVFVTHNETATGVVSDVAAVRRVMDEAFHDALLFVDGVSSIGSVPFDMAAWGVDLAVTGSQKGLMMPAGLGILGVSEKAIAASKTAQMRRAYYDFADMLAFNADGYFPYTPPTPLLHGLRAALALIADEGLGAVHGRHARLAEAVRRGTAALGLSIVAEHPTLASDTVTALRVPQGVDAREVLRIAYEELNCSFGAGLGPLAGKAFRIGHLGALDEGAVLTALSLAELALVKAGAQLSLGAGVAAAQSWFAFGTAGTPGLSLAAE